MHWAESHGFELLVAAFIFSMVTSVMPPLPAGQGFWSTWLYNIIQIFGANLGNLVKHTPAGTRLETLVGTSIETLANGDKTVTELATQKETSIPKS